MMAFAKLRRSVAFFVYPEIRNERLKLSRADYEKIKRSGVIDRMADLSGPKLYPSYKAIKDICNRRAPAAAEASELRLLRQKWLRGEKSILAEHHLQLLPATGASSAINGKELEKGRANAICGLRIVPVGIKQDGVDHQFKRVNSRGGILERLDLFVRHVLLLLRLRNATRVIDSAQAEPEKDRA